MISDTYSDILSDMCLMRVPVKHEGEAIVFKCCLDPDAEFIKEGVNFSESAAENLNVLTLVQGIQDHPVSRHDVFE